MDIGIIIKKLRVEKGFSLRRLANITNISFSHLSKIENSKHLPTQETLLTLAKTFELTEYEILTMAGFDMDMDFWISIYEHHVGKHENIIDVIKFRQKVLVENITKI